MKNVCDVIRKFSDYVGANGKSDSEILCAEKMLGVEFAEDYKGYLSEIGLACFDGRELTGVTDDIRLDVVSVTLNERVKCIEIPTDWYVVEQANINGIVIWQNKKGEIYQTKFGKGSVKVADSLYEYISI